MRRKSYGEMNCSVARALDVVGDPWTLLIVRDAMFGFSRFEDFQRRLEVPRNTLSSRLNTLTEAGVLSRNPYQNNPARYEYRLTPKGWDLRPVIITLLQWGDSWGGLGLPPVVFRNEDTGCLVEPELVDAGSGTRLADLRIRAIPNPAVPSPNSEGPPEGTGNPV
jgi:DNA-binding HxlR family transcriptional regulator